MQVNLKLLHTFLLVAETGSFTQAGEKSGRSTSAVSMQIRELEKQLGIELFDRTTRRVELTLDGSQLLDRVRKAMTDVQGGIDELLDAVERRKGRIRLACAPTVAATYLSEILAKFRERHPHVVLSVRELVSADLLTAVRSRDVDFGIGPRAASMLDLHFEPLVREPLCALVPWKAGQPKNHDISVAELRRLPLILLSGMPLIAVSDAGETVSTIEEVLQATGNLMATRCQVRQANTAVAMAAAGLGVCIVPKIAVPTVLPAALRSLAISEPTLVRDVGVVTLKDADLSKASIQLVAWLKEGLMKLLRIV